MATRFAFVCIDPPDWKTPARVRVDQVAAVERSKADSGRTRVTLLSGAVLLGSRSPADVWDAMREAARSLEAAADDE